MVSAVSIGTLVASKATLIKKKRNANVSKTTRVK